MPLESKSPDILLVVAAALIRSDGRILVQQRPEGKPMAGLWEFPGGKVDRNEVPEKALARELAEELGIAVDPAALVPAAFASEGLADRHLLLLLYITRTWSGDVHGRDGQAVRWLPVDELDTLEMPPADLPLVKILSRLIETVPSR
jgi:8-oxo-dGTP diphosphatase